MVTSLPAISVLRETNPGAVVNQARSKNWEGAGHAVLLGGSVDNAGTVSVPMGKVGLGAGEVGMLDSVRDEASFRSRAPSTGRARRCSISSAGTGRARRRPHEMKARERGPHRRERHGMLRHGR